MNNDRGLSGERRESLSVTLQWCTRGQSPTPTLNRSTGKISKNCQSENVGTIHDVKFDTLGHHGL